MLLTISLSTDDASFFANVWILVREDAKKFFVLSKCTKAGQLLLRHPL
jgi:hypothetical protein